MTEQAEDPIAFVARQLLEMNQSLQTMSANLGLVKGWMDGQEEITRRLSTNLADLVGKLTEHARVDKDYRQQVDNLAGVVDRMNSTLGGVAELSKSTFDMVLELKARDIPGGVNEQASPHQASL